MRYSKPSILADLAGPHYSCFAVIDVDEFHESFLRNLARSEYLSFGPHVLQLRPNEVSIWRSILISGQSDDDTALTIEVTPTSTADDTHDLDIYFKKRRSDFFGNTTLYKCKADLSCNPSPIELPSLEDVSLTRLAFTTCFEIKTVGRGQMFAFDEQMPDRLIVRAVSLDSSQTSSEQLTHFIVEFGCRTSSCAEYFDSIYRSSDFVKSACIASNLYDALMYLPEGIEQRQTSLFSLFSTR